MKILERKKLGMMKFELANIDSYILQEACLYLVALTAAPPSLPELKFNQVDIYFLKLLCIFVYLFERCTVKKKIILINIPVID